MARRGVVCALVALVVGLTALPPGPAAASTPTPAWHRPVPGPVVRAFAPPATAYGAGHLGADLRAAPGTPVRAAGDGVVTFAGTVAGARHVVVGHEGDLRTSYSFLATVAVRRGARVRAGDVVGTTGGTGTNHGDDALHLGLRAGDEYLDPMLLFRPVDLAAVVHLAPTTNPPWRSLPEERRGLLDGLRGAVGSGVQVLGGVLATGAGGAVALAAIIEDASRVGWERALAHAHALLAALPPVEAARVSLVIGGALAAYVRERRTCDPGAPRADGSGGSGNHAVVVAGIDSRTGDGDRTVGLPTDRLGYERSEVSFFSYAGGSAPYTPEDTYAPILESAHLLAAELRARQRTAPGRPVDLLAHSQGGVVVLAFLELVYDPEDPSYPPIGPVVTFSSPLDGAPIATAIGRVTGGPLGLAGDAAAAVAGRVAPDGVLDLPGPDPLAPSVADLAEDSELMRRLRATPTPDDVHITAIGASGDLIVPADAATTDGAAHHVVATWGVSAHTAVLEDPAALRAARAALEGRALPCRSFATFVAGAVVPPLVSSAERQVTAVVAPAAGVVP